MIADLSWRARLVPPVEPYQEKTARTSLSRLWDRKPVPSRGRQISQGKGTCPSSTLGGFKTRGGRGGTRKMEGLIRILQYERSMHTCVVLLYIPLWGMDSAHRVSTRVALALAVHTLASTHTTSAYACYYDTLARVCIHSRHSYSSTFYAYDVAVDILYAYSSTWY